MATEKKHTGQFLSVMESHKGIIYKIANAYCRDVEDRQDLIQEITLQLWKCFGSYDNQFRYSTWIYRIALNVAISMYRKEHRRKEIASPITDHILHLADVGYNDETDQKMTLLQQFITELKELDKALMLLYLEQKSHKEMAEILDLTETNIATKIGRIKEILKQKFVNTKNQF